MNKLASLFSIYILPGVIFQSLVIGGGYGTGRELVEFFLRRGPASGLLSMLIATVVWSAVLCVTYEYARTTGRYDYKTFISSLLGKAWTAYEITYCLGMILVVSVVGAASGEIIESMFGFPNWTGTIAMMTGVAVLLYLGTSAIEKALSFWSFALYTVYIVVIAMSFIAFQDQMAEALRAEDGDGNATVSGLKYAAYNIGTIPAILFSARHIVTRRQAILAGLIAGPIAMLPAAMIYFCLLAFYPGILESAVPVNVVLSAIGIPAFQILFQIILLGTFVETAVGMIHGFNERIASSLGEKGRTLSSGGRLLFGVSVLLISVVLATYAGLVTLIARGYGTLTWAFMATFVVPVLTIGTWRLASRGKAG